MSIIYRIVELLRQKGITAKKFCEDFGYNRNMVSDWKSGKSAPELEKIADIAEYFCVSCEYLLTGIDKKGMEGESQMFTAMQQSALTKLLKLNELGVSMLNGYLDGLLAHNDFQSELAG